MPSSLWLKYHYWDLRGKMKKKMFRNKKLRDQDLDMGNWLYHEPLNIYSGARGNFQNIFRTPLILFGTPQIRSEPSIIKSSIVFFIYYFNLRSARIIWLNYQDMLVVHRTLNKRITFNLHVFCLENKSKLAFIKCIFVNIKTCNIFIL